MLRFGNLDARSVIVARAFLHAATKLSDDDEDILPQEDGIDQELSVYQLFSILFPEHVLCKDVATTNSRSGLTRLQFNKLGYEIYVKEQSRRVPAPRAKPGNPGYGFRRARWRNSADGSEDLQIMQETLQAIGLSQSRCDIVRMKVEEFRLAWDLARRPSRPAGPGRPRGRSARNSGKGDGSNNHQQQPGQGELWGNAMGPAMGNMMMPFDMQRGMGGMDPQQMMMDRSFMAHMGQGGMQGNQGMMFPQTMIAMNNGMGNAPGLSYLGGRGAMGLGQQSFPYDTTLHMHNSQKTMHSNPSMHMGQSTGLPHPHPSLFSMANGMTDPMQGGNQSMEDYSQGVQNYSVMGGVDGMYRSGGGGNGSANGGGGGSMGTGMQGGMGMPGGMGMQGNGMMAMQGSGNGTPVQMGGYQSSSVGSKQQLMGDDMLQGRPKKRQHRGVGGSDKSSVSVNNLLG